MERREFVAGAIYGLPVLGAISMCSSCEPCGKNSKNVCDTSLIDKATTAMLCIQRKSWEQGTAMQALIETGQEELLVLMASEAMLRSWPDGRLGMVGSDNAVTDPASNGLGVLHAYKITGDEKYKAAADKMYRYLKDAAPKTADGILHHNNNAPQVWSDSMFMAPPFLAMMGDYDEAVKQIDGFRRYLWDGEKKLFCHIWDEKEKSFKRKDCWGGGNGWSAACYSVVLEVMPNERQEQRSKLIGYAKELLDGCIARMRADGLFHDVIDKPETFVETNLSQMLAYAIYKGVASGWLDKGYLKAADTMRAAAFAKVDSDGQVQGACASPFFDRPGTSAEAQAFLLMMEGAFAKL